MINEYTVIVDAIKRDTEKKLNEYQ